MAAAALQDGAGLEEQPGFVGGIPVRNLWLLMLYASDLRHQDSAKVATEDAPDDASALVAEILCYEVERRLRRSLSFGYLPREEELHRVRGRIDLLHTERRRLLDRGKVACRFEELVVNTPRNRFVRAALERLTSLLAGSRGLASAAETAALAHRCRSLATSLLRAGVTGERPGPHELPADHFGRHDMADRRMVAAAQLAFDMAFPNEDAGRRQLMSPERRIQWIRTLYEKAVAGFYRVALAGEGWQVAPGRTLHWPAQNPSSEVIGSILPTMRTDIELTHRASGRHIVIDTKFNQVLTKGWHRDSSLRSGYLYQIYAYLRSQEGHNDPLLDSATGILLHPTVGGEFDESVEIQGHRVRFATVDLAADTQSIRRRLLEIVRGEGQR